MQKFKVFFFEKDDGSCPVEEFLSSLDKKMRTKMLKEIALLQDVGNELREPYSKHLDDGIFELRAKQGNDICRVLYFFIINKKNYFNKRIYKKDTKNTH
ncbi:type II toxin-antitoxin system RelE/ParE family toxin [Megamonas sp.]